nr:hypothetical protein BaRGS_017818 [Batillaria attramentaria]
MAHSNHADELCDVCALTHDWPAVAGFDFGMLGSDMEDVMPYLVHKAHERGAIITMSWHTDNLVTGGDVHINNDHGDVQHSVKRVLPGGDHHHQFEAALDKIAAWAKARVDSKGHLIPIIFRPWHEADGGWFWWGLSNNAHNTADDIKRLYQETVKYLRDTKGVHNFLYAFSPDCGGHGTDDDIYPGDNFVDIWGTDCYKTSSRSDQFMQSAVEQAVKFAESHGKIAALTEFGPMPANLEDHPHWFNQEILHTLTSSSSAMRIAYMLTWTNQCYVGVVKEPHI